MFGSNDDQRRFIQTVIPERIRKLADGGVDEFDFAKQGCRGRSRCIEVSAGYVAALLNELLANADRLEVHAEEGGHLASTAAEVIVAPDPVQDRVHLQRVIALDVLEAVGPGGDV